MYFTDRIKKNILIAAVLVALLFVFGTAAYANVTASPTAVSFGNQAVGTASAPVAVILTNTGRWKIKIGSASLSTTQFSYSGPSFPVTLSRGQSLTAYVTFRPGAAQAYSDALIFTRSNDSPVSVPLSGAGVQTQATPLPPTITTQPASQTVTAGQTAAFSVAVTGTAPFTYQWKKNGTAVSGATSSTYTTPATTTSDNAAQFTVVANDSAGSATSTAATLTVNAAAVVPSVTTQPASQTVTAGQTATFSVAATGTAPFTYQWKKNGTAVSGATSTSYTTPATTTSDTAAQFTVVVANSAGSATSTAATLTVNSGSTGCMTSSGTWVNSPLSQTASGSVRVTFDATPSATPIDGVTGLSYGPASAYTNLAAIVRFNGSGYIDAMNSTAYTSVAPIPYLAGTTYQFTLDVDTLAHTYSAYVMIGSVQTTIGSHLAFRAEQATTSSLNNVGAVANPGSQTVCNVALSTITVAAVAPAITTQPASKTVTAGQTATFSVVASGTSPTTYQWKKNGTAISGATSTSYTTPGTTTSDNAAQFTVVVANSAGSATSTAAILTVNAATYALNSSATALSFGSVFVSLSSTQNVTFTNAGNSNVTISNVSISGAGLSASGVSTGLILTPGQTVGLSVTFAPAATGSVTGNVAVTSNATNSPVAVALSGTGATQVNHSVSLSWSASTSVVTGYNSYSSTKSGGPYTKLTTTPVAATTYTDTTVQAGQTYYYVVTSVDSSSVESAHSTEISTTVP